MTRNTHALAAAAALAVAAVTSTTLGTGGLHSKGASAAIPNQLPFMCFNTAHTFHQTFGPNSFFLNENQQGPTGFQEGSPTSKPTVTFPLRKGTAAGHLVYYFITDASDQSVARALGVNFTPKLANAALVQLPSGVVINAPQVGDGANANGADKAHWADKVESVDAVNNTVTYDETNGCYEDQSVHYISSDASAFGPAAIEDVTYAPALGNVPFPDCGTNDINVTGPFINPGCGRESLIAFINGQRSVQLQPDVGHPPVAVE